MKNGASWIRVCANGIWFMPRNEECVSCPYGLTDAFVIATEGGEDQLAQVQQLRLRKIFFTAIFQFNSQPIGD